MNVIGQYQGMPVVVSEHATHTGPRFPDKKRTKRRMRRVIGRYGSWEVTRPIAFQLEGNLVVHPRIADRLRREAREASAGPLQAKDYDWP